MISFEQALQLTVDHIPVLEMEDVSLLDAVDRITAVDLNGRVDSPSANVSLKDGYAIQSADITAARDNAAVSLRVVGSVAAGADLPSFRPLNSPSRLQMMASADAIVRIPEGVSQIEQGQIVEAQLLR